MDYSGHRIKKICGRCGKEYDEHRDYNDKGIKLCIECYINFFDEQNTLRKNTLKRD